MAELNAERRRLQSGRPPGARDQDPYSYKGYGGSGSTYGKAYDVANPNDDPGASTIEQVRQYLLSVLDPSQLQ